MIALEPILKLYEELPDAHLFMYDRLDGTVIDPEYTNERQTFEDTCTQLHHFSILRNHHMFLPNDDRLEAVEMIYMTELCT